MIEIMPNQVENLGFCRNMSINADVRILPLTPPLPHVRKCPLLVDSPSPLCCGRPLCMAPRRRVVCPKMRKMIALPGGTSLTREMLSPS